MITLLFSTLLTLTSPGTSDATKLMMSAVAEVSSAGGGTILLNEGDYHFYSTSAVSRVFHVSNHDQPTARPIFLPFEGVSDLTVKGKGRVRFVMHGAGTAILMNRTRNVTLENLTIEWERPFFAQATILGFEKGETCVKFLARDRVSLSENQLVLTGEDWIAGLYWGNIFDRQTHAILPNTGDVGVPQAREGSDGTFRLAKDLSTLGAKVGDAFVMRDFARPHPAICLTRARDTVLKRVTFRDGFGMGLLAQLSENITVSESSCTPRSREEYCSNTCDAIHCSNCRGLISVTNSTFEGMMDDALNVHSTSLAICERRDDHTIRCRYMHPQAVGLDLFRSGNEVRFIAGKTLENGPVLKIKSVRNLNDRDVVLVFEDPIPAVYREGDAIENASWYPRVIFSGNRVANNRARGVLFTTPEPVVCAENVFDNVSGSAVLLPGDAQGWYESGACQDVLITRNRFVNCLTSSYQYCVALISIFPEVKDLASQKTPYHRNVRILDNHITSSGAPLIYKVSVEDVTWRDNRVD